MGKDYNEIMCQAVDTLITHRLKDITYDKTIICEIIDDSDKEKGHYIVSDGTIKFDAYSESNKYRKSNQVYVIIPQGDYSQQKVILSKYTASNANEPMVYISPLGTMVTMTDNLISNASIDSSILANDNTTTKLIWQSNLKEDPYSTLDIQNNSIYTSLGIKAKFKCQLNNQALREGNYGLRLDLFSDSTADNEEEYIVTSIYLDTDDMFGDPYNFITYFEQEKMFDISNLNSIWGMNLYLYQNKNFKYYDSNKTELQMLPTTYSIGTEEYQLEDNIFVSDIYIAFGNDMNKISDNTFEIYTNNILSYSKLETEDKTYNFKNIYSIWYNKNENNEFLGFSDGIVDETYDEDTYRQEYETTMQGATLQIVEKNIPRVKEALQIYSNAEDLNSEIQILADRINKDLYKVLNALEENLIAYDVDTSSFLGEQSAVRVDMDNFNSLLSSIAILNEDLDTDSIPMVTLYKDWLKSYDSIYNELLKNKDAQVSIIQLPVELNEYCDQGISLWEKLLESLDNLYFSTLTTIVKEKPATEAYIDKSTKLYQQVLKYIDLNIENIVNLLEKQGIQLSQNLTENTQCDLFVKRLIIDKDTRNFDEEYQDFINKYANKYCVYWYRYEAGYEDPNERYLKPHWRRMEYPRDKNNNIIYPKPGMPIIQSNGMYAKKSEVGYTNIEMNYNVEAEKFKAILFFNHIPYYSNELIFENDEEIVDAAAGDLANALYIELGRNAAESFQLYGNNNQLVNLADANLIRQLRVRYDGVLEKDEGLIDSWVYWYVPKNSSMLVCKNDYLLEKDFMYLDPDDKNLEEYLVNYKPGYDCFFKKIRSNEEISDDGTIIQKINEEDTYFYFLIEKYYSPTALNNEILCRVVKNGYNYETSQTFTFSTFGTSGTNYTLSVLPVGTQTALINIGQDIYPLELQANFYDYNNELVDKSAAPSITWSWAKPNKPLSIEDVEDANNINHKYINGTLSTNGSQCLYNVVQCEVVWNQINKTTQANQDLTLRAYYPVPYSTGHYYIEGASTIIYDDLGKNPSYYKGPYKIYNTGDNSEVTDVTWKIRYFRTQAETGGIEVGFSKPENGEFNDKQKRQLSSIPKIHYRENASNSQESGYYLVPVSMYVENTDLYPVVICEKNSQVIWAQPIFITQNRYGSSVLNSWDENLTIDEENGIILSTMMGAGYKDDENRFNGVVMGDVRTVLDGNNVDAVGLYGFHEGAQSFGFKVDGTAFIGKSGHGRILMDGNKGQIQSAAYGQLDSAAGMLIDLDDGYIEMRGTKIGNDGSYLPDTFLDEEEVEHQSKIRLDVQSPYLTIQSNNKDKNLVYIGSDKYYLQSNNYEKEDEDSGTLGDGMKIDLVDGHIDAYNFKLTSNRLFISSEGTITSPYIRIKDNINTADEYDDENNLLLITDDKFEIQSGDYFVENFDDGTSVKRGMRFIIRDNDSTSKIEAYSGFSMELYDGDYKDENGEATHYIKIKTNSETPFKIGRNFNVDWDGNVSITGGSIEIKGAIEKEVVNADGTTSMIVTETLFKVTNEGVLYATGANISGTITASHISGSTIESNDIKGGTLSIGGGQLTADDKGVIIKNATITNCNIQNGIGDAFDENNKPYFSLGSGYNGNAYMKAAHFDTCIIDSSLSCDGPIYMQGSALYFGPGNNSNLQFNSTYLACSTTFQSPTISTQEIVAKDSTQAIVIAGATLKEPVRIGDYTIAQYIENIIDRHGIDWSAIKNKPNGYHSHKISSATALQTQPAYAF